MRAAWYEKNGPAKDVLILGEITTMGPSLGEVRVKLHASGVNPSDVKSRMARPVTNGKIIPHSDGAGVIEEVGAGVSTARVGERVWIWNGQWKRPFGTAAEYIVLPEEQAVSLPKNTSFAAGACLGIPALTAFQAVHLLGDIKDKTVLVIGAAAAVGHYAAQLAVRAGAKVIGTASAERAEHARAAGVATVIDYKREDVAARVAELTMHHGVDAIIDMDLSSTAKLLGQGVLEPHGTVVCYGSNHPGDVALPFRALLQGSTTLKFFIVYDLLPEDRKRAVASVNALLAEHALKHSIGKEFLLDQIVAAHEAVEGGKLLGNVVLTIG
jgi:NADPH2:quinone reductase